MNTGYTHKAPLKYYITHFSKRRESLKKSTIETLSPVPRLWDHSNNIVTYGHFIFSSMIESSTPLEV